MDPLPNSDSPCLSFASSLIISFSKTRSQIEVIVGRKVAKAFDNFLARHLKLNPLL